MNDAEEINGFRILRGAIPVERQSEIVAACRKILREAPLVQPVTAWGKPMSVRMTSAGRLGWVIERGRYRYADCHPETGRPWPPVPDCILEIWRAHSGWTSDPDSCLMNWYDREARMGLHQDRDEGTFEAPVLSISIGDSARFRMGGPDRNHPTTSTILNSGDVVLMGGAARLAFHGVDRIIPSDIPTVLPDEGRLNLTLRVVSLA